MNYQNFALFLHIFISQNNIYIYNDKFLIKTIFKKLRKNNLKKFKKLEKL